MKKINREGFLAVDFIYSLIFLTIIIYIFSFYISTVNRICVKNKVNRSIDEKIRVVADIEKYNLESSSEYRGFESAERAEKSQRLVQIGDEKFKISRKIFDEKYMYIESTVQSERVKSKVVKVYSVLSSR